MKILLKSLAFLILSTSVYISPNPDQPINPTGIKYHKDHFMFYGSLKKVVEFSKKEKGKTIDEIVEDSKYIRLDKKKPVYVYPKEFTYSFDQEGYLLSIQHENSFLEEYHYDENKHLDQITRNGSSGSQIIFDIQTDRNGNPIEYRAGRIDNYVYNSKNQLTDLNEGVRGNTAQKVTAYTYHDNGKLKSQKIQNRNSVLVNSYEYEQLKPKKWKITETSSMTRMYGSKSKKDESVYIKIYTQGFLTDGNPDGEGLKYEFTIDNKSNVTLYENVNKEKTRDAIKREFTYW